MNTRLLEALSPREAPIVPSTVQRDLQVLSKIEAERDELRMIVDFFQRKRVLGLTDAEKRLIAALLMSEGCVTRVQLNRIISGAVHVTSNTAAVFVSRVRAKMAKLIPGFTIDGAYGRGYSLNSYSMAALRTAVKEAVK